MKSKFTPVSVVKQKRPAWMTPDFNPQIADKKFKDELFTPYAIIPLLLDYLRK
jgi:hypothetical protein